MDAHRPSRKPSIVLKDSFFDRKPRDFSPMAPLGEPQSRRSSHSPSSDYGTPISPTFSNAGHQRNSSSSTAHSSPVFSDTPEFPAFTKKAAPALPDVVEHPFERDGPANFGEVEPGPASPSFDYASRWSQDIPVTRDERDSFYFESFCGGPGPDFFSDSEAPPMPLSKRRRSGESSMRTLTDRFMPRLPSLSRRRHQKRASANGISESHSGVSSPVNRSRSNSRARSLFRRSGATIEDESVDIALGANGIDTIAEDEADDEFESSQLRDTDAESVSGQSQEVVRVPTPLLPHLMNDGYEAPTEDLALPASHVAPANELAAISLASPAMKPRTSGFASPALSSQPSLSVMHRSQGSAQTASSSETPASSSLEEGAEWSELLGHADFHIEPSPYMPEKCTRETCQQLVEDWERAKKEFTKHLCDTSIHYGNSSKTFRLTQEKWEWLNSIWRQSYVRTRAVAIKNGEPVVSMGSREPAPVLQVPSMGDKFPMIGENGVIGPMEQGPPLAQPGIGRRPSTKQQLMRKIGSMRRRRGRSDSAAS